MKNVDSVQGNPIVFGAFNYRNKGNNTVMFKCGISLYSNMYKTYTVGFKVTARRYKVAQLNEQGTIIMLF
jgi:hypothetical protein